MSSYVVENATINAIVSYLRTGSKCHTSYSLDWVNDELKRHGYDAERNPAELGREMHILNCIATAGRYRESVQETVESNSYTYRFTLHTTIYTALKELRRWLYQCAEGSVPQGELFRLFDGLVKTALMERIIDDLPAYQSARDAA